MKDGRDLRNKIVKYKGLIYTIGGHGNSGASYDIKTKTWRNISNYGDLI